MNHPLCSDLLSDHLCMWHQTLPQRMDCVYAPPIGVSSIDGREVQIEVMGRHRGQHPRCPVEHAIGDERPNFIRDLRQLDGGRTGAQSQPEHLGDHHLRDIVNLVEHLKGLG